MRHAGEYQRQDVPAEAHPGHDTAESGVRRKFGLTVVGVKSPGKEFTYATPETVISNHDLIIVSGTSAAIEKFATVQG